MIATQPLSEGSCNAVDVEEVSYAYAQHRALKGVSFSVGSGEIFGLLGPNGGGKTTLFRILSTLAAPSSGVARIFGNDTTRDTAAVRRHLGVVFQRPSLDAKLTVAENLRHHGHLYGIRGHDLRERITASLQRLGMAERASAMVETLSGGLQRRVELAKGLLSTPRVLILDEPSTGLDPGARRDLWSYLSGLRDEQGTTILVTTHLMEEAECCDRLAILDQGNIVSMGTPDELRRKVGGDVIVIRSSDPEQLSRRITEKTGDQVSCVGDSLRIEKQQGHILVRDLVESFSDLIDGISLAKPTLEDVFVHETGHRFWDAT